MKKLAIIGAGELGKLIAYHAIADKHYSSVVFFDDYSTKTSIDGNPVLGKIDEVEFQFKKKSFDELLVGIGYKHMSFRKKIVEKLENKIPLGQLIHSSSYVDESVTKEQGCIILPGCTIDTNVVLNKNVLLNTGCTLAHDCKIGSHSFISPAVAIAGFVSVGECCFIGINTTIIDTISIAPFSQTGGGTVVISNIEMPGLYVGNPAKFVR